jgi:hypothetical protein
MRPHRPALIGCALAIAFILLVIPVAAPGYIAHADGYNGD